MNNNMNIGGNGLSDADIKKYEELYRTGNKTVVNQVKLYCEQTNAGDELDRFESTMTTASNDTDVANTENKSFIGRIFDWFKDALGFNIDLDSIPDSDSPATLSSIDDTKGVDNIQANSTASVSAVVNEDGKEISDEDTFQVSCLNTSAYMAPFLKDGSQTFEKEEVRVKNAWTEYIKNRGSLAEPENYITLK